MELLAIAFALCSIYLLQLQLFHFDSGKTKHMVLWLLILCSFGIGYMLHVQFVIWLSGFFPLYCILFFYCDATLYDKLRYGLFSILAFFIDYLVMVWLLAAPVWIIALSMVAIQYGILLYLQLHVTWFMLLLHSGVSVLVCYLALQQPSAGIFLLLWIGMVQYLHGQYAANFEKNTRAFQEDVMAHHYAEVKSVYMNMRGWRHDYHNHLQSLKAYLQLGQYEEADAYLFELEKDLDSVDALVKSGNLMVDAILNSKLTIAKQKQIHVQCKAHVAKHIAIRDIDLCVIIGNLLDNAIEACEMLEEKERFIRIYIEIVKQQLYMSFTNAAMEDLNFNQKSYISEKRGNHGHGMKRVKLTVERYDGYLNLQNEPGVFVSEIMLPIVSCDEEAAIEACT